MISVMEKRDVNESYWIANNINEVLAEGFNLINNEA